MCASTVSFQINILCDLTCMTASLSRCVEASPSFEQFMLENQDLATKLMAATECCFDSDSGHAVRRTCSARSQAITHISILRSIQWLTLILTLVVVAAIL